MDWKLSIKKEASMLSWIYFLGLALTADIPLQLAVTSGTRRVDKHKIYKSRRKSSRAGREGGEGFGIEGKEKL